MRAISSNRSVARRVKSTLELTQAFLRAAAVEGPTVVDRVTVRAEGRRTEPKGSGRLPTSADWSADLHALLAVPWPCPMCAAFMEQVWAPIRGRAGAAPAGRDFHDGDPNLARAAWSVARHVRPAAVVETGVARGMTSAAILSALRVNGSGRLYSIDLPPLSKGWAQQSRIAVAPELEPLWTYVRGSSRRRLPPLLAEVGSIDVFVHDSLHTADTMGFEFRCAWDALRVGGVMMSDDIDDSLAFEDFVEGHGGTAVVGRESSKSGNRFGVLMKTSA